MVIFNDMKNILIYLSTVSLFLIGCNELEVPNTPDFRVIADKEIINVGDTVNFKIEGYSDYLTFYSGEKGSDYNFKNERLKTTEYWLEFRTERRSGNQENQFSLHISTDFNGVFEINNIENETHWTPITDRFVLAEKDAFSDYMSVNVTDLVVDGKPFYLGWKYVAKPAATHQSLNTWRFRDFYIKSISEGDTIVVSSQTTPVWKFASNVPINTGLYNTSSTRVTFNGNTPNQVISEDEEIYWAINSKIFSFTKVIDVGPDSPISIKSYNSNNLNTYSYIYEQSGAYEAVFVGVNGNVRGSKETVKKISIQVE